MGGQIIVLLVTLGTLSILGRILSPREFGLFGIVSIFYGMLLPFIDMALTPSYIKLDQDSKEASDVFFTINVAIGILASITMIAMAPIWGWFFEEEEIVALMMTIAIAILFSAMSGQPNAVLNRSKRFDRVVQAQIVSSISGAVLVVILAWQGFGVWSLVWRAIFENFVRLIMLVWFSPRRFHLAGLKKIRNYLDNLRFALSIVMSRIPNRILLSLDQILVGKMLGAAELGSYSKAQQIAKMPDANIRSPITSPALAYLARIAGGAKCEHYISLSWIVYCLAGTVCVVFMVEGDWLMPWLMGPQWQEAGSMLQWLGLWGVGKLFHSLGTTYHINEQRMPRWIRIMIISIPVAYLPPLLSILSGGGIRDFVIAYALSYWLYWTIVWFAILMIDYGNWAMPFVSLLKKLLIVSAVLGFGMMIKGFILANHPPQVPSFYMILNVSAILFVVFIGMLLVVARREFIRIKSYIFKT